MKKLILLLTITTILVSACGSGNNFENDVRKMGELTCKGKKLTKEALTDTTKLKDIAKLQTEVEDFAKKMEEKYKGMKDDTTMNAKADKIMQEVLDNCK
jgi:hypothetical protein